MGALSFVRLLLLALIWAAGLGARPNEVAALLVLVGLTQAVDWLPNRQAARDVVTDKLLLVSMAALLFLLRPKSLDQNVWVTIACLWLFAAAVVAGLVRYRRLPALRLYSSKPAGLARVLAGMTSPDDRDCGRALNYPHLPVFMSASRPRPRRRPAPPDDPPPADAVRARARCPA